MIKKVSILGSTGSIGKQTLSVIAKNKEKFNVHSLSGGENINLLLKQSANFKPKIISVLKEDDALKLKKNPLLRKIKILNGDIGLKEISLSKEADILVSATSGVSSLIPTLEFLKLGKRVCVASKEIFLLLGNKITEVANKYSGEVIPIDSEHSGLFQLIKNEDVSNIKRVFLTASGGPFFGKKKEELRDVTPKEALNHPTWSMGNKISIDSATMMNKAIEIIEASIMFNIPHQIIHPIVNRKSHIHSIVEFIDGNIVFSGSYNDMRIPIGYALNFPNRLSSTKYKFHPGETMNLIKINEKTYKAFNLARKALDIGESMPAVMNAANTVAVEAFLKNRIKFTDILKIVDRTMKKHKPIRKINLKNIMNINEIASKDAYNIINK